MSEATSEAEEPSISSDSVLGYLRDWYHVPVLAVLLAFMFWVRSQAWSNFVRGTDVLFSGNDPWYHYRQIVYVVHHWPQVMPFDPWTYFPFGTAVGQFGTLFDQLIATAALIVGLGSPSQHTVAMTVLFAPPVIGALVLLPTYVVGRRLGGRVAGIASAVTLALLPGVFLVRSLVGAADHNIAEPLFQATAVLALLVAIGAAERDRPVWDQVADRDFAGLRAPLGWSLLAGVMTALYMWVWPPGALLVGIVGVYFVLKLAGDYVNDVSPDHLGIVAVVSMTTTGLLMLYALNVVGFSPTKFSLLQPLLAFGVAAGAGVMMALARVWNDRDLDRSLYPVAVGGLIVAVALVVWLVLPDLFALVQNNVFRIVGFGTQARTRTIGEAQPWLAGRSFVQAVVGQYRIAFFAAIFGALWMAYRVASEREIGGERQFVLVWFVFLLAASFTQVRFNYYLAVPIAILTGYLVARTFDGIGLAEVKSASSVGGYQVIVVALVLMVVFVPFLVTVPPAVAGNTNQPAWERASGFGPGGIQGWDGSLQWMQNNTPVEGNYAGAGNQGRFGYYGTYAQQEDFDYPAGSYGVLSWWDYGHWITTRAHRVPNANPFQEGTVTAANFLLAQNETAATQVLENVDENDAKTRYVMVDWQMQTPGSKFGAITQFYTLQNARSDDFRQVFFERTQKGGYQFARWIKYQKYYDSMMVRLYRYHGSAMRPQPVVVDWSQQVPYDPLGENVTLGPSSGQSIRQFDNMSAARAYVKADPTGTRQIGGVGSYPSEYVPALQHYRLVKASERPMPTRRALSEGLLRNTPAYVKTFERVPGATVQGQGPANATVTAQVNMSVPSMESTFVYTQRAQTGPDGEFTMTLPYSTTGYDQWGPGAGYTNVSVRSNGGYVFQATNDRGIPTVGTANVTEGQVVGENDTAVSVTLEPIIQNPQNNGTDTGNSTDATGSPDSGSSGGNTTDSGSTTTANALQAPERTLA